jgi:multidrug efflux system membrane fusion protein
MAKPLIKSIPFWLTVAVLLAGGFYLSKHMGGSGAAGAPAMGPPPVDVAEITTRTTQLWRDYAGRLVAVDSASIRPRVSGTIDAIHFKDGQWVNKGAALFTIDQKPYAAALASAQSRAVLTQAELGRAEALIADKAIPQREFDQRKSEAAVARADLIRARLNYNDTVVRAPISGRVGRAELTVGNLVDAGGNAPVLTTVVSSNPIYADFDIDEQAYLAVLKSAGGNLQNLKSIPVKLGLSSETDAPHVGQIQSFDNQLNISSGTLRVRAVFDNPDGTLIPGLFARVQLGSATMEPVILIDDKAINTDQSVKFVWVVGADNKVVYRPVILGPMAEGLRVITSGLKPGERIVVNGTQRVMMPGQPITPHMVTMGMVAPAAAAAGAAQ